MNSGSSGSQFQSTISSTSSIGKSIPAFTTKSINEFSQMASQFGLNPASGLPPSYFQPHLRNPLTGPIVQRPNFLSTRESSTTGVIKSVATATKYPPMNDVAPVLSTLFDAHVASYALPALHTINLQQQFHRLKVEDALTYLDLVKSQFGSQPQVYNRFLDIMKEFKSHSIDTPGVIERVSQLFRGHPDLIVGFNTFLPLGYKIEIVGERGDHLSISTPTGLVNRIIPSSPLLENTTLHNSPSTILQQNTATASSATEQSPYNILTTASLHSVIQQQPTSLPVSISVPIVSSPLLSAGFSSVGSQPLEFNHAISYVNKIKNRFQHQPEVYKQFLEILHSYQKQQKIAGATLGEKNLSESEVYQQVAKLFHGQPDLLSEFSQFLPEAITSVPQTRSDVTQILHSSPSHSMGVPIPVTSSSAVTVVPSTGLTFSPASLSVQKMPDVELSANGPYLSIVNNSNSVGINQLPLASNANLLGNKDAQSSETLRSPPPKRRRRSPVRYDVNYGEAVKHGTLDEFQFFDKVRRALRSEQVYENFLRCLVLFNKQLISRSDLIQIVTPFLGKAPDLLLWIKEFLGCNGVCPQGFGIPVLDGYVDPVPQRAAQIQQEKQRISSDLALEIDYMSCKQRGTSYRALPLSYSLPLCSGRTLLCREVLNDHYISCPCWLSEGTASVSSKKSQYEEFIYRTEDERFELDIVIEINWTTVQVLEDVYHRIQGMSAAERQSFVLDDCLGGRSKVLHKKAIARIYGDRADEVINFLKTNPAFAIPIILKRLKMKDEEWRTAQKSFNKTWREQNEKFYLKSLDHQCLTFKQNDMRQIRSKILLNQIETIYDERLEMIEAGVEEMAVCGPHFSIQWPSDLQPFYDANDLLIHHVKRQTGMQRDDKTSIKRLLRRTLPELFSREKEELSDDEDADDGDMTEEEHDSRLKTSSKHGGSCENISKRKKSISICDVIIEEVEPVGSSEEAVLSNGNTNCEIPLSEDGNNNCQQAIQSPSIINTINNEPMVRADYSLMFVPNAWYIFLRLHCLLCQRLDMLRNFKQRQSNGNEEACNTIGDMTAAQALQLASKDVVSDEEKYPRLIEAIKNLLDGQFDWCQFEDQARQLYTTSAYVIFTAEKIIQTMVRQLKQMVSESLCLQSFRLWETERSKGAAGGLARISVVREPAEAEYQRQAELLMVDQNCFKTCFFSMDGRVTFELLNTDSESQDDEEAKTAEAEKANNLERMLDKHIRQYLHEDSLDLRSKIYEVIRNKPPFLARNVCKRLKWLNFKLHNKERSLSQPNCVTDCSVVSQEVDELCDRQSTSQSNPALEEPRLLLSDNEEIILQNDFPRSKIRFIQGTGFALYWPRPQGYCIEQRLKSAAQLRWRRFERWLRAFGESYSTDAESEHLRWLLGGTHQVIDIASPFASPYRTWRRFIATKRPRDNQQRVTFVCFCHAMANSDITDNPQNFLSCCDKEYLMPSADAPPVTQISNTDSSGNLS